MDHTDSTTSVPAAAASTSTSSTAGAITNIFAFFVLQRACLWTLTKNGRVFLKQDKNPPAVQERNIYENEKRGKTENLSLIGGD